MNRHQIKSLVLLVLIIINFILTTRIWFNVSIEGIFIMPRIVGSRAAVNINKYSKYNLSKPQKLLVNNGKQDIHKLILNGSTSQILYKRLNDELKSLFKHRMFSKPLSYNKLSDMSIWDELRKGRNFELRYGPDMGMDVLLSLLDVDRKQWSEIKSVNSAIVSPLDKKVYILDEGQSLIFEFTVEDMDLDLGYLLNSAEEQGTMSLMFLNEYLPTLFDRSAIVSIPKRLPIISVGKEKYEGDKTPLNVASFFNNDKSILSMIKDPDGTVIYTDREGKRVKIDTSGMLEYVNYNISNDKTSRITLNEALDISTDFINNHIGFPEDTVIYSIDVQTIGDKEAYTFKYGYRYEGIPIVFETDTKNAAAIEIEIFGKEVKRYKRLVRVVEKDMGSRPVKIPIEILDILLSGKVFDASREEILKINEMHVAYLERNYQNELSMIPVWVVNVTIRNRENKIDENKQFVINAETGIIIDK